MNTKTDIQKLIVMSMTSLFLVLGTTVSAQVALDSDDIGGMVTSTDGPEAGVWVIAETDDFDTFYAKITIVRDGQTTEVDCRPSDAIAIAVRSSVPIFVEDGVLDKAGIVMDKSSGRPLGEDTPDGGERTGRTRPGSVSEKEIESMSAFSEFIQDLQGLEDLGGAAKP